MLIELQSPLGKSQQVRLLDIVFLGPSLLYIGAQQKNPAFRWSLILSGAWTIAYNWANYTKICKATKDRAAELAELDERPSFAGGRLIEPRDFKSYFACDTLT